MHLQDAPVLSYAEVVKEISFLYNKKRSQGGEHCFILKKKVEKIEKSH